MSVFDRFFERLIEREGGYSDHASDAGGKTRFGITEAVARAHGYDGAMRDLPREVAREIYDRRYWSGPGFDRLADLSVLVAEEVFDTGVNMGPVVAAQLLQRALNKLNRRGRDYADIVEDGQAGPVTRAALSAYLDRNGAPAEARLVKALNVLQGARYFDITPGGDHRNEDFMNGWLDHRVSWPQRP
ncbi:glycoside hydrolase family 108 protein [Euryhalocaulis caribicus]|uniref:glycoside hydrolase family 108 protein n=1 Tax=Euryhalocaulis caribicus TaxID=1161401 RepID=UPI00039EA6E4|nr:glycosyl hydrolase 108 family protein [Euryhalocaulis caribicus]